jgi:energy-coupling factor transporter transmembrane protein EcfT
MTIQVMLRFLPSLALSAEKSRNHRPPAEPLGNPNAKFFDRIRQLLPLLIPLFTVNLQQADALANAMIARCYGSTTNGQPWSTIRWGGMNWLSSCSF